MCTCSCSGVGRGAPTRAMRPPSAMRRERGESSRTTRPPNDVAVHMLQTRYNKCCVHVSADAGYATSERDAKRARRVVAARRCGLFDLRSMLRCTCFKRATTCVAFTCRLVDKVAARRRVLFDFRTRCEESAASSDDAAVYMLRACNSACCVHELIF
jgi:hypothetical protein